MDGEVTYADLKFPPNAGAQRGTRAKTAPAAGSSLWVYSTALLGILCLLLLATSIGLGVLLLRGNESSAEHEVQNEDYAQNGNQVSGQLSETESILNQTRAALRDAEERLQNWTAALAGLHWYCPEGWTLGNGVCYFLSEEKGFWATAQKDCFAKGGNLVIIRSNKELKFFSRIADPFWVGIVNNEKRFKGQKDLIFSYIDWDVPYVSVRMYDGYCAVITIGASAALQLRDCRFHYQWICEQAAIQLHFGEDHPLPAVSCDSVKYTRNP
ncbi:killer cell lectin-like receptor subfamily B member 1B allele A [Ambystoma mexicanum]|uniref:killer cell lectin-like receptor subfamily B member 1B allele A n=1 Tax=Ambystoma mexicanum TaxID=8296 RepID=UPI0037E7DBD3